MCPMISLYYTYPQSFLSKSFSHPTVRNCSRNLSALQGNGGCCECHSSKISRFPSLGLLSTLAHSLLAEISVPDLSKLSQ